jgi:3-hydroxyacyl-CoA dehydrogenase
MDSAVARLELHGRIAVLTIDNPPVNALGVAVRRAVLAAATEVAADSGVEALVLTCAGKTFCAGADIREFGRPPEAPSLPEVVAGLEALDKPVVAALHGTALGGGLELAMGCHWRVAAATAQFGLPEVKLGLSPGAGGTQLLPRLVGMPAALRMATGGASIVAEEALGLGLIDAVAEAELLAAALELAARVRPRRTRDRPAPPVAPELFDAFLAENARRFRGLEAPPAILRALRAAAELPFEEGRATEREVFVALRGGTQSRALRHLFFAEREAVKLPGLPPDAVARTVTRAGVIGAGMMGSGIAVALLLAGLRVTLVDMTAAALDRGAETVRTIIRRNVEAGRSSAAAGETALAGLMVSLDAAALGDCELVIEAAFERMEVKREVFGRLDAVVGPETILATNTSYLDVDAIAAATARPERVVGMHFFAPAQVMKLLEVIHGRDTAPDVLLTALQLARRMGKTPVVSGNAHGFIGNRLLAVRRREAEEMVLEGASPYDVDRVVERFGLPMGPFRLGDLSGLDLGWSAETTTGTTLREVFCEAGRRGQKTQAGYYDYDVGRNATPSADALALIAELAARRGYRVREFDDAEIEARMLWPMVDEGARLLEEGVAARASDIDLAWVNGYGWPAWTGGPMFHADTVGTKRVAEALQQLGRQPSNLLTHLAATDATFNPDARG